MFALAAAIGLGLKSFSQSAPRDFSARGAKGSRIGVETTPQQLPFSYIVKSLNIGDPKVTSAVHELGHYHGIGLANVINAYNPHVICIGGLLALLGSTLVNSIWNTLKEMIPERFLDNLEVYNSDLGELGVAYGGVSMVISQLTNTIIRYSLFE